MLPQFFRVIAVDKTNQTNIDSIKEVQRGIKQDVERTREMVYDLWKRNGGTPRE